jgi:hypothetical protein
MAPQAHSIPTVKHGKLSGLLPTITPASNEQNRIERDFLGTLDWNPGFSEAGIAAEGHPPELFSVEIYQYPGRETFVLRPLRNPQYNPARGGATYAFARVAIW